MSSSSPSLRWRSIPLTLREVAASGYAAGVIDGKLVDHAAEPTGPGPRGLLDEENLC